jgi:sugar phosphate isomerase/epimerase
MIAEMKSLRLAIQTLLLPGKDLEEKFDNAKRFGFDGVEIVVGPDFDLHENLPQIQKASRSSGLLVSDICTHPMHDPCVPDTGERRRRLEVLAQLMQMADELDASGVICVPVRPPFQFPDLSPRMSQYDLVKSLVIATLSEWFENLPKGDSALFLEPLNRYEAYFLNRIEQAVELCLEINHPRVKILADFFHMNIEEASFSAPIRLAGDLLGMLHIADNNRLQPGRGCMDYRPGFAAMKAISYNGFISIECWSSQGALIAGDPEQALPATVEYLRRVWQEA